MKFMISFVIAIALLYLVVLLGAYLIQTSLLFHPGRLAKTFQFEADAEEVFLTTNDHETINGLFFNGTRSEVILYFHGNSGDLGSWQTIASYFTGLDYHVFIIDYRAYGKSTGTLSEKGFYLDADAAYDYVIQKGFSPQQIIVYGRSLGTGVATDLVSRKPCKGLVLEAPYTSMTALATEKAPFLLPALILKFRLDSQGKLAKIHVPIVFFHGTHDGLIPTAHTETLYASYAGPKKKFIIEGAVHNDISSFPAYHQALKNLFE